MGDNTKIEWTDASWTPIRARWFEPQGDGGGKERIGWHCEHVSEGCRNCYAEGINVRLGTGLPFKPAHLRERWSYNETRGDVTIFLDNKMIDQPMRWQRPRMIFVCSMTDLFGRWVTDAMLDRVFAIMAATPRHIYQILTKRPERMWEYIRSRSVIGSRGDEEPAQPIRLAMTAHVAPPGKWAQSIPWPLPNVWLGISAEDQAAYDARWPILRSTAAAVRWVSAEPLLGPIRIMPLVHHHPDNDQSSPAVQALVRAAVNRMGARPDWIVVGGESGPGARPMHPAWALDLRDQCAAMQTPFLFKQWGDWKPLMHVDSGYSPTSESGWCRLLPNGCRADNGVPMQRVGKKFAGRLLDGILHDGMPAKRPDA